MKIKTNITEEEKIVMDIEVQFIVKDYETVQKIMNLLKKIRDEDDLSPQP